MRRDKGNEGTKRSLPVFTKHYHSRERREEGGFLEQADMLLSWPSNSLGKKHTYRCLPRAVR